MQCDSQTSTSSKITIALLLTSLLALSSTGCTRPRQTTAVGSGVGGAIGAGLGAIVGNQSGNAGSGLAIGAAAGAATGALIGNALQAQEERTTSNQEALKRQEQTIAAQKNEIAQLRSMQSDSGSAYSQGQIHLDSPRYRYRQPTIDLESPEVARQRARLQQRGPRPAGGSSYVYSPTPSYQPRATSTGALLPKHSPSSAIEDKQLARFDVRAELATKSTPQRQTETSRKIESAPEAPPVKLSAAPVALQTSSKTTDISTKTASKSIEEKDIPVASPAKLAPPAASTSSECKEAFAERDLANEAKDNSDKLYHLRRSLRLCPNSAPLHLELGKVYASMERKPDAEREFKQALSIDPNLSAAKSAMGDMLKGEVQF